MDLLFVAGARNGGQVGPERSFANCIDAADLRIAARTASVPSLPSPVPNVWSLEACQRMCSQNEACAALVFNREKQCHLKAAVAKLEDDDPQWQSVVCMKQGRSTHGSQSHEEGLERPLNKVGHRPRRRNQKGRGQ